MLSDPSGGDVMQLKKELDGETATYGHNNRTWHRNMSLLCSRDKEHRVVSTYFTPTLQALVHDIFPSTTAVFSYATGPRKLSAIEKFFVDVQSAVSLLQTIHIISDVCFITDHVAYTSSDKHQIV